MQTSYVLLVVFIVICLQVHSWFVLIRAITNDLLLHTYSILPFFYGHFF